MENNLIFQLPESKLKLGISELLKELNKYTGKFAEDYLMDLINGNETLESLAELRLILREKNNPKRIIYSNDEIAQKLGL